MRIADVSAYAVKYPAKYIFTGTPVGGSDYFLRPGFPTVYSTHNEALLVKVTADDGRIGWGEALAPVIPEAAAIVVARLVRPLILDQDPREVELLWDRVYDAMRVRGHLTGLYVDAIAAVDVALWDLAGQAAGLSVSHLLGGRRRERVEVYYSGVPGDGPDEVAANARAAVEMGYRALKLQLGHARDDLGVFAAVRDAVGPGVSLALDAHWHYSLGEALAIGRGLEKLGAAFFECPIAPEDVDGHAELCAALDVPIALGEAERTRFQFLRLLQARAIDIAQPDVGRTGLTEARRIGALCETFNAPVAPHVSTGLGIRFAATLHYAAALSNFLMLELQPRLLDAVNASVTVPFALEGSAVAVPNGHGLGVTLNQAAIEPHWQEIR